MSGGRLERMQDALRIAKTYFLDCYDQATVEGAHIGSARHYEAIWQGLDDAEQVLAGIPDAIAQAVVIGAKHGLSCRHLS